MEQQKTVINKIREESTRDIQNRRKIAALSAIGMADFSAISLFQLGYIKKMPDLPGKIFDSEKVNSSKEAVVMGLPDGVVSLSMYAATLLLTTIGAASKKQSRWTDLLLGGIILGQAAGAAYYLYNMAVVQKKVCVYCVGGALVNFATLKPAFNLLKNNQLIQQKSKLGYSQQI